MPDNQDLFKRPETTMERRFSLVGNGQRKGTHRSCRCWRGPEISWRRETVISGQGPGMNQTACRQEEAPGEPVAVKAAVL